MAFAIPKVAGPPTRPDIALELRDKIYRVIQPRYRVLNTIDRTRCRNVWQLRLDKKQGNDELIQGRPGGLHRVHHNLRHYQN